MREILFRGWRKNNRGWVCGSLVKKISGAYIISEDITGCIADYTEHEVDPETVCQYTGLTDKNGKKIFEGDCLECKQNVVEYTFDGFTINGDRPLYLFVRDCEVVGNIFDKE